MEQRITYKKIWTIAYPIGISLIMEHLIGLTDTAFLGRVGEVELGASALGGIFFGAMFMLGLGFSIGAQIMMARRNGERRYREIGAIFQQGLVFTVGIAAVLILFSKLFSPWMLGRLIRSEAVYAAALDYLDWRIWGLVFAFVSLMFRSFYVATTRTRIMTLNSIVMVASNVVLNYALIFGKFGFPALGIAGAAIASTFSEFVSMAFYLIYTAAKLDWRKYRLFCANRLRLKLLGRMLNVSGFVMIQHFLAVATWFIFFLAIEHQGERPLAVTNLVRSLSTFLFFTVAAFSSTTATLAGNLMGAGRAGEVMPMARKCMKFAYMCILPVLLVYAIIPGLSLRTTMLVGYPGETERDFEELLEFVRTARFERLGVFPYSAEEGTFSGDELADDVPEDVKQARGDRLMELQAGISAEFNRGRVGRTERVIVDRWEGPGGSDYADVTGDDRSGSGSDITGGSDCDTEGSAEDGGFWVCRSQWDSPEVDTEILVAAPADALSAGQFVDVRITAADEYDLFAEPI